MEGEETLLPSSILNLLNLSPSEQEEMLKEAIKIKQKGNLKFSQKEYESAITFYKEAINLLSDDSHPKDLAILHSNLATCYFHKKSYQLAIEACTASIKFDEGFYKPRVRRAMANEVVGGLKGLNDALNDYETLSKLDGGYTIDGAKMEGLRRRIVELEEKDKAEMLGKFKELGNQFLGNFGLNTDMFNVESGNQGSYSINLNQKK